MTAKGRGRGGAAPAKTSAPRTPGHGGPPGPAGVGELPDYAERVLAVAEVIPPGRVLTYGDIAARLADDEPPREDEGARRAPGGGGPRQVGRVMALYGAAVPWWRVVRADGALLPGSESRALAHYRAEGTPLREPPAPPADPDDAPRRPPARTARVDMRRARWHGDHAPLLANSRPDTHDDPCLGDGPDGPGTHGRSGAPRSRDGRRGPDAAAGHEGPPPR